MNLGLVALNLEDNSKQFINEKTETSIHAFFNLNLFKIVFRGQGTALESPLGQRSLKNRRITFLEIAKVTVLKFPRETELMVYCSVHISL